MVYFVLGLVIVIKNCDGKIIEVFFLIFILVFSDVLVVVLVLIVGY